MIFVSKILLVLQLSLCTAFCLGMLVHEMIDKVWRAFAGYDILSHLSKRFFSVARTLMLPNMKDIILKSRSPHFTAKLIRSLPIVWYKTTKR